MLFPSLDSQLKRKKDHGNLSLREYKISTLLCIFICRTVSVQILMGFGHVFPFFMGLLNSQLHLCSISKL